jgi:glycosyltransferase involved in cell wall biosynthesis
MKKKVLVRGPALSQSGYGEHARMILRALWQREDLFDVYILPTGWGHTGWISDNTDFRAWMDNRIGAAQKAIQEKLQFDISVQVCIPNEFERLAPINIGVTAGVETTKVSPLWLQKCNEMTKVIVPSTFAKWGFENTVYQGQDQHGNPATLKLQVAIEVIPYPVRDDVEVLPEFSSLGLNEDDFAYLMVGQWGPRKNMDNAVRWWLEENWEQDVVLVVKTSHRRNNIMDREFTQNRLKVLLNSISLDKAKRKCSLKILHGDMSEAEMKTLYHHPAIKCMVTATHGEGFGLPLFEFAQTGKLIVAPGWSGHLDFLTYTNEKGEQANGFLEVDYTVGQVQQEAVWEGVIQADSAWCFPEESSYKQRIRQARTKYKKWEPKTKLVAERIREYFTLSNIGTSINENIYGSPLVNPVVVTREEIPKISLITSVFKAEDYIEQLMEDVTRQTIFEDKCEWVILNANKTGDDFEEEVIKKYIEKYPNNIVYKRLEEDNGVYDTWNKAIEMSTGEFITNINCDDRRAKDGLEKQAKMLVANSDISLVYNDSFVSHRANVLFEDIPEGTQRYNFEHFSKEAMLRGNLPHNNPMWRKTLHEKHGYFDQKYRSAGDWDFWLRCAFGNEKFAKHPDILGVYYFNPKGMSTNPEHDSWKKEHEKEIFMKYATLHKMASI